MKRVSKISKKRQVWEKKIDFKKKYLIEESLEIIAKNYSENFNATVDLVFALNLNLKKPNHLLKGVFTLPFPQLKKRKICVLTEKFLAEAEKLKPFLVGGQELIDKIAKTGSIDFDLLLATPEIMPKITKIAKKLNAKRLMPSVKKQTLGLNISELLQNWQNGQVTYSVDSYGNLHLVIGKIKEPLSNLVANFHFCYQKVMKIKPNNIKGQYLKGIYLSTTMGPSFQIKTP